MSSRANALGDRCDRAIQAVVDLIARTAPDTLHRSCEAEGWTATAVAAHIALSQDFLIDRVRRIVDDEEFPPFDAARSTEETRERRRRMRISHPARLLRCCRIMEREPPSTCA